MNGTEFYNFLRLNYVNNGQHLYGNFTFRDWLYKHRTDSFSFRFNIINNNAKSIPREVLIAAWDANQEINDHWLENNFNLRFHNDCRLHIINFLINENNNFR